MRIEYTLILTYPFPPHLHPLKHSHTNSSRSIEIIIFLLFWAIFCPFTLLITQKIKIWKIYKKPPGNIILLHMCTINEVHMMHGS